MRCDLSGTVSLVTGAVRGIGQAIADRLAENGSMVVYTDVDESGARAAAARTPGSVSSGLDVTKPQDIAKVIDKVLSESGRLDILVNNAGINTLAHRVTLDEFPREEWDRIIAVDLTGLYEVSKAAARVMRAEAPDALSTSPRLRGWCLFASRRLRSGEGRRRQSHPRHGIELGPYGILVNGIAPGSVLTEGTRRLFYAEDGSFHAHAQRMLDHVPLGRPGLPGEIAVAALFLADPENSYTNGHILTVDGGWTAGYTRDF